LFATKKLKKLLFAVKQKGEMIYLTPVNARRSKATMKVKIAEPITAQIIGKGFPSIFTVKKSGKPNLAASHKPI
jgi:hypothetical protein